MSTQDLVLNIAVNLGRLSRWAMEGKNDRIDQFIKDTEYYLKQLDTTPKSDRFIDTYEGFKKNFQDLKTSPVRGYDWAEKALTWANILQHRAKLA